MHKPKLIRTIIEVEEIRGACPHYKVGDKLVIDQDGYSEKLRISESTNDVCFALLDGLSYRGVWTSSDDGVFSHITAINGESRTACVHAGPPYTECGGVIFRIYRRKARNKSYNT
jgi:hypothetical protein